MLLLDPSIPLTSLKASIQNEFLSFDNYMELVSSLEEGIPPEKKDLFKYEKAKELQTKLNSALFRRPDRTELLGLSALQIGLPFKSVYMDFQAGGQDLSILLTDPELKSITGKAPSLFIKLIKCPNSPTPYHVGLFNNEITISSSNRGDFQIFKGDLLFGERGEISANIQRAIWADKGYIPGYGAELPMNYRSVCEVMERNASIRETFDCQIHRDEILHILDTLHTSSNMDIKKRDLVPLKQNLVQLLTSDSENEWIKVPAFNLFEKQYKMFWN